MKLYEPFDFLTPEECQELINIGRANNPTPAKINKGTRRFETGYGDDKERLCNISWYTDTKYKNKIQKVFQHFDKTVLVRVNPIDSEFGKDDMKVLAEVSSKIDAFMLPKVEEVKLLNQLPKNLVLLIETPKSVQNLEELASHKHVIGIALGGADLSASLGSDMSWDSLLFTRSKIVIEAAVNNLFTIDSPFMNIEDISSLQKESVLSNGLGFDGKAAIHPNQIETITKSFLPNESDIQEAKEIIKLFNSSSEAVIAYKGKMIDMPIVLSMEKRLRLVGIELKNID